MAESFRKNAWRLLRSSNLRWWIVPTALGTHATLPMLISPQPPGVAKSGYEGTLAKDASISTYQANERLEDRHMIHRDDSNIFAAVLDGHGGWQASEFVKENLWDAVKAEFKHTSSPADPHQMAQILIRAYQRTDRGFINAIRPAFSVGFGEVARVGACCVSALITKNHLVIANAGDCRAVLARKTKATNVKNKHELEAIALSRDHNSRMEQEKIALARAHPNEDDIVLCRHKDACYVKGRLQPTRSFGDAYLKYSEFNGRPGKREYGRHISPPYTPPYITATPEITTHEIANSEDAFVILACDGVWDVLENSEAVDFIANDDGDRRTVAARLAEHVLRREATSAQMTLEQLMQLPPGRYRRRLHDDLTIVILFLDTAAGAPVCSTVTSSRPSGSKPSFWSRWFGSAEPTPADSSSPRSDPSER